MLHPDTGVWGVMCITCWLFWGGVHPPTAGPDGAACIPRSWSRAAAWDDPLFPLTSVFWRPFRRPPLLLTSLRLPWARGVRQRAAASLLPAAPGAFLLPVEVGCED